MGTRPHGGTPSVNVYLGYLRYAGALRGMNHLVLNRNVHSGNRRDSATHGGNEQPKRLHGAPPDGGTDAVGTRDATQTEQRYR